VVEAEDWVEEVEGEGVGVNLGVRGKKWACYVDERSRSFVSVVAPAQAETNGWWIECVVQGDMSKIPA
jgi:hypothetical protein